MKRRIAESSPRQVFSTFLIKKSWDGKMGLWFVLIYLPKTQNITSLPPVWRKIEDNGLPINIGNHLGFTLRAVLLI
jgi:hypothetical protein